MFSLPLSRPSSSPRPALRAAAAFVLAIMLFSCLPGGAALSEEAAYARRQTVFFDVFDTIVTLIAFSKTAEDFDAAAQTAQEGLRTYHRLFDQYNEYPDVVNIHTLNASAALAPVAVSRELFDFLLWCKTLQQTYGSSYVNIAMGSVLSLWHDARENGIKDPASAALPDRAALEEAALHTDIDDLILDEEALTVYYRDPLLKLDVGAVGKGYAAEKVRRVLLQGPVTSFILNAGGNVCLGEGPMDGRPRWGVGIQDPDSAGQNGLMETLYAACENVVTSGDYQRYYTVDGKRYAHLISPETLMPAETFRSVTVIGPDGGMCDFLSTWLFIAPFEEGLALIDSLPDTEAFWVFADRSVRMTDGMARYAKSAGAVNK